MQFGIPVAFKLLAYVASTVSRYKNTKSKLLKCNASIYFNKGCLASKLIPKYAHVKFTNNSPAEQLGSQLTFHELIYVRPVFLN